MRRVWAMFLIVIGLAFIPWFMVSYGNEEPFVYQKSGRDPFWPWVTKDGKFIQGEGEFGGFEDVVLQGIIWDPKGGSMAMMNGRILRKGDRIGRFEVISIDQEEVTLQAGEKQYTLRLVKPELGETVP